MNVRERFQAVMNFQPFDRLPIIEWATWWDKTINRWQGEGLPIGKEHIKLSEYFGLDLYLQTWIPTRTPLCPVAENRGDGICANIDDYEGLLPHLYPVLDNRERWNEFADLQKKGEAVLWFTLDGFFWFPRELFGIERHMYAFFDQPDLMHQMNSDLSDWMVRVIDEICSICKPDFMTFAEDMSYNHGPMLSKQLFDEFIAPYYKKVVPHLKENGIIPMVDSDGDVTEALSWFEEVGIEGLLPLERQAGVDMVKIRKNRPKMRFIGAFDKLVMNQGEGAMRAEFERLTPVAAQGGYLISCDHQTPPGVSLEDYRLYLKLFNIYALKAAKM